MAELTARQVLIVNAIKNITRLLSVGFLGALTVLVAKLMTHGSKISISNIDIPIRFAWIVFGILTVSHIYASWFVVHQVSDFWRRASTKERNEVFEEIRSDRNLLVHGLVPRVKPLRPGSNWYGMDPADPSAWAAYIAQALLFVTLLPWQFSSARGFYWTEGPLFWVQITVVFLICSANWYAGSAWIISISRLASDEESDFILLTASGDRIKFGFISVAIIKIISTLLTIITVLPFAPLIILRSFLPREQYPQRRRRGSRF